MVLLNCRVTVALLLHRQANVYPWNCIKVKILTEAPAPCLLVKPKNRHKVYTANTPLKAHDYRWRNLTQRRHIIYMTTHSTHTQNFSTIYKKLELFSFFFYPISRPIFVIVCRVKANLSNSQTFGLALFECKSLF